MSAILRHLSTGNGFLKREVSELGNTKITDVPKTAEQVKKISRGLWARYQERYFTRDGGSFMPIFHLMLAIGIFGYSWEYPHLRSSS